MEQESTFCVFCETGREASVEAFLTEQGFRVITSTAEMIVFKGGKRVKELRPLLPGYVFFAASGEPNWRALQKNRYLYRPVGYPDGRTALRGPDLDFVQWLLRNNGPVRVSKAVREGTRIRVIDGPLKDYEGRIEEVNHRRQCVKVRIATESFAETAVWLAYEAVGE